MFEKYTLVNADGYVNVQAFDLADEAFALFKKLYDHHYGCICEDGHLISIHTGGWSENEALIADLKNTAWWFKYHRITARGGHYYFNTDFRAEKDWLVTSE